MAQPLWERAAQFWLVAMPGPTACGTVGTDILFSWQPYQTLLCLFKDLNGCSASALTAHEQQLISCSGRRLCMVACRGSSCGCLSQQLPSAAAGHRYVGCSECVSVGSVDIFCDPVIESAGMLWTAPVHSAYAAAPKPVH